jgi:hypothetical protein
LRNCFGSQLSASIVLTNLFTSYEYRFEDILARINVEQEERGTLSQGSGVLCQAFADKDNPLAWAVLAHEYGHTLNDLKSISRDLVHGENSQKPEQNLAETVEADPGADVIAETVADFVAANVLGPASLMPILFIEMMIPNLSKKWAGHPPTPLRVRLVREYLKTLSVTTSDFEAVFDAYSYDYASKLQKMKSDDRETIEKTATAAEKLLSPLANTIATKVNALGLRQFEERNSSNARTLQGTLASRLPIASRRRHLEKTIFGKLNSIKRGIAPEEAYRILSDLDEFPAQTSEILTAGWLYRLATFEKELKKTFQRRTDKMPQPGSDNSGDSIESVYGKYVEKTDTLLLKSLELTDVHRHVLRRLEATG